MLEALLARDDSRVGFLTQGIFMSAKGWLEFECRSIGYSALGAVLAAAALWAPAADAQNISSAASESSGTLEEIVIT
ncbi:MAG TPA: hypothetical protein VGE92_09535, partial [Steroidobacteraceae bacterium]